MTAVLSKDPDGMTVFNTNAVDTTKGKMFFGPPLGVQRYDKFKYPIFDRLTQTQLGFLLETRRSIFTKTIEETTHS